MRPRVGIAIDYLAAAFVTLALFALPVWVIALAAPSHSDWLPLAFTLVALVGLLGVVRVVRGHHLLSSPGKTLSLLLRAAVLTWVAAAFTSLVVYAIEINASLCGGGTAGTVAWIGGFAIFTAVGAWSLTSGRFVLLWAMPLAPALGFAWALLSLAVLPSGHGYCET